MKNLRIHFATLAWLAGSVFAISTNADATTKLKATIDGYYAIDQNTPPAKLSGTTNLGLDPAVVASNCWDEENQCVAEFETDGSLVLGTLINGNLQPN